MENFIFCAVYTGQEYLIAEVESRKNQYLNLKTQGKI